MVDLFQMLQFLQRPSSLGSYLKDLLFQEKRKVEEYFKGKGEQEQFISVTIEAGRNLSSDQKYYCLATITDISFGSKTQQTKHAVCASGHVDFSSELIFPVRVKSSNLTVELFTSSDHCPCGSISVSLIDRFLCDSNSEPERLPRPTETKFFAAIVENPDEHAAWHHVLREDGTKYVGELFVGVRKKTRFPPAYDVGRISRVAACIFITFAILVVVSAVLALKLPRQAQPTPRGAWRSEPPMNTPRAELAAAFFRGRLFAIGGCCALPSVESLGASGPWRTEPSMLSARARAGTLVVGDKLLAVGGMDLTTVEAFDGNSWGPTRADLLARRASVVVFLLNASNASAGAGDVSRPCAYGREGGMGTVAPSLGSRGLFANTAECLQSPPSAPPAHSVGANAINASRVGSSAIGEWVQAPAAALPSDRLMFAATSFMGGLAVVGGWLGGPVGTLEFYDPDSGWRRAASMPTPRYALAAAEFAGRLYAVGGSAGGEPLAAVESFDGAAWRSEAPISRPRQLLALAAFGDRLFAMGGRGPGDAAAPLADVESYALTPT